MTESPSFGAWLRQRRNALGLTRQELAQLAACAAITVEKIEIGERRPSTEVAQALANALRIPPAEREVFVAFARGIQPAGAGAPQLRLIPNNLPNELPALIGRSREVEDITRRLARGNDSVLTLVGPGGVGKTLLALHIAARCAQGLNSPAQSLPFQNGILFVDLSPIRDPDFIVQAIADSLASLSSEVSAEATPAQLAEQLGDRSLLLVLDNFEQVLPAAGSLSRLLAACPNLCLLVTSREPLRIPAEQVIPIATLSQPAAVSLFLERAQAANPRFKPAGEGMAAIDSMCRHLDGLPLAIELVAARVKLMSPQALLERLVGEHLRLGFVADGAGNLPARQRTLRETLAWSYRLLSPEEQRLFCRLSVFVGGCDVTAAEHIAVHSGERAGAEQIAIATWNALASLLDKSLLVKTEPEHREPRFILLETIREYAQECLRAEDEHDARQRLADYYFTLARKAAPQLEAPKPQHWLHMLEAEQGNLRAALAWLMAHDPPAALRMCAALGPWWHIVGAWREGRHALETALEKTQGDDSARAGALHWLGRIARKMNDSVAALNYSGASVALHERLGEPSGLADAIMALGWARYSTQGCEAAAQCFERGLALYRDTGDTRGIAHALLDLSHMVREQNADYGHATRYLNESRLLFRLIGDEEGQGFVILGLANLASLQGDYARCRELAHEAIDFFERIDAKGNVADGYETLGETSYFLGDFDMAECELQTALQMQREMGSAMGATMAQHHLSRLRRKQHRLAEASDFLHEALSVFRRLDKTAMAARCVATLGGIALDRHQHEQATTLLGAAQRCFDQELPFLAPADVAEYERDIAACRAGLGDAAFEQAWAAGQAMPLDAACDLALAA